MLHLFRSIFGLSVDSSSKFDDEVIDWAIEKLVDGTDTRLRVVSGYKRKLRDCVERSASFVDEAVDSLPPPLAVEPRAFTANHEIRTWFGTIRALHEAFSLSLPVQQFVAQTKISAPTHFFAGMRASIEEKTVLVSEMHGEVIRRDVSRTAFAFTNHSIVAPAATEEALRLEVKERAYMNLVEQSLSHLVSMKRKRSDLEKEKTLLRSKLRALQSGQLGLGPFVGENPKELLDTDSLETRLGQLETELGGTAARIGTLDQHMDCVIEVMSSPEERIRITPASVRVTRMGLLATDESTDGLDEVAYTRVDAGDSEQSAVRLVSYPVEALMPPEQFRPRL